MSAFKQHTHAAPPFTDMTLRAWSTVPQRFETKANRCSAAGCASTSFRTRRTSSSPDTSLGVEDIASTCCASTCWRAPTAAAPPLRTDRAAGRIRGSRGRNRPFGTERRRVESDSCVQRRAAFMSFVPRVQAQGGDAWRSRRACWRATVEARFEGGGYLIDPIVHSSHRRSSAEKYGSSNLISEACLVPAHAPRKASSATT